MFLVPLLLACTGEHVEHTGGSTATVAFLQPVEGESVAAGDVAVSLIVENFTLVDPAKHNEGAPEGYISVSVDGAEVHTAGAPQFTVSITEPGAHTLAAELHYTDGDALEPPARAEISITVE